MATAVARREGLEAPIPITQWFQDAADAEESRWQELVIKHLRLSEWVRLAVADELDWIGPVARESLLRYRVLYPPNAFFMTPLLRHADRGTVLTGIDGDSIFRLWRSARAASVLARRARPVPRDVLRIGLALAPARVRAWRLRKKRPLDLPWLHPDALEVVRGSVYGDLAAEPFRWSERVAWVSRQRDLTMTVRTLNLLAQETGAAIAHPFLAPRFLAALAHAGGRLGFGELAHVSLFGSLLPNEVVARRDKAEFSQVFWGPHSRDFISRWPEETLRLPFVDSHTLLETWRGAKPHVASATILQALWLHEHAGPRAHREQLDREGRLHL